VGFTTTPESASITVTPYSSATAKYLSYFMSIA